MFIPKSKEPQKKIKTKQNINNNKISTSFVMEVTMNELNYWFHDHKAKRESYAALQSVELKFTSENGNCDKCSKFQLLSTRVYLTYFAFYILLCVPLGFNLSENPRLTTFLKIQVRIHLFTVKKIE